MQLRSLEPNRRDSCSKPISSTLPTTNGAVSVPIIIPLDRVVVREASLQNLLSFGVVRLAKPLRVAVNGDLLLAWVVVDASPARTLACDAVLAQSLV